MQNWDDTLHPWKNEMESAYQQHQQNTRHCLPLSLILEARQHFEKLTEEEQKHLHSCSWCQKKFENLLHTSFEPEFPSVQSLPQITFILRNLTMKLIYETDGNKKIYEFPNAQTIRIGREKENSFQINHRSISKHHCEITLNKGQLEIKDLGSSNGTYINGDKITTGIAGAGDSLRVGHVLCTLEGDISFAGATELDSGGTVVDENFGQMLTAQEISAPMQEGFGSFGKAPSSSATSATPSTANTAQPMGPIIPEDKLCRIKVLSGAPAQTIPIRQPVISLGTDVNCTIVLDAPGISAKHAEIAQENGKFILRDLNSKNGIYVNREKVFEKTLNHGDSLQICGVRLAFDASAIGARNSKLLPMILGVFGLLMLATLVIKIAVPIQESYIHNESSQGGNTPLERYKNLIHKTIEHVELRRYAEALTFVDEARRQAPPDSSRALVSTLKSIISNLWKEDQMNRVQLEELRGDLRKMNELLKSEKWEQPKAFAEKKLVWTEEQIRYSETIGNAKTAYAEAHYFDAINQLKKVPKDSILFNSELENTLTQWREEHEARLIKEAQQLMSNGQFRQAIPILDEAQGTNRKYNTDIVKMREICEANMEAATLLAEAKDRYKKLRNQDALSKLAKIPQTSLLYEEANTLKKQIYAIQIKEQIVQNYQGGNGEEALRLLSEVDDAELKKLEKKIRDVVSYFDKINEQRGYTSPDRTIIRDNAKAVLTLEDDEENYYKKEAIAALEEFGDVQGLANKLLSEARTHMANKKYGEAKTLLAELLAISELEEDSPEKQEAKILYSEMTGRIAKEYLQIINAKVGNNEKAKQLKELLKAVDQSDKYYLKIQKQIEKYEAVPDED